MELQINLELVKYLRDLGYYVLPAESLARIQTKANKYTALVEHGVDNWPGYEEAMQSLESEDDNEAN